MSRVPTLDLHHLDLSRGLSPQEQVEKRIDTFLTPYLRQSGVKLKIITGRGLNSNRFINGKNPVRYYAEQYLDKLGVEYQEGSHWLGEEGVLLVWV